MINTLLTSASLLTLKAFMPPMLLPALRKKTDGYKIARSLRFNSADSAYLSWTPAGAPTSRRVGTIVFWLKRTTLGNSNVYQVVFSAGGTSAINNGIAFGSGTLSSHGDMLEFFEMSAAAALNWNVKTAALYRDPSAHGQIVIRWDTTQATASDRVRIEYNGQEVVYNSPTYPPQNSDLQIGHTVAQAIGRLTYNGQSYLNGYVSDFHYIDGQALDASHFGQIDPVTGVWVPKEYTGTYGNNGFHLDFSDNSNTTSSTLGKDRSGNDNDWTPNNFSVAAGPGNDSLTDTPTNYGTDTGLGGEVRGNYPTLNALDNSGLTLTNGNLDFTKAGTGFLAARATIPILYPTYLEVTCGSTPGGIIGFGSPAASLASYVGSDAHGVGFQPISGAKVYNSGANTPYGTDASAGDVLMFAIDPTNKKYWVGRQGTWFTNGGVGNPAAGTNPGPYSANLPDLVFFMVSTHSNQSGAVNFGQRPFAYAPPAGFKALCTQNLPEPTIKNPREYFDVNTRAGTGASGSVSGKLIAPDIVWSKSRSTRSHMFAYRGIGVNEYMRTDTTDFFVSDAQAVSSFNSDGYSFGNAAINNTNGENFVDWLLKTGTLPGIWYGNISGDGASTKLHNHSLGAAPHFAIVKSRGGASNWVVWHRGLTSAAHYLLLNETGGQANTQTPWGTGSWTSTQFMCGTSANALYNMNFASSNMLAVLMAEVSGFSRFSSYTGNASTDGPFVYCGFKPRWILLKNVSVSSSWHIWDTERNTFNPLTAELIPNANSAEDGTTTADIDVTAFGFKIRNSAAAFNGSGNTVVFAAFADVPAKYARAA